MIDRPTALDYLAAARCPLSLEEQEAGLWYIERRHWKTPDAQALVGWPWHTALMRWTDKTIHLGAGEIVMEDSRSELSKHLPIMMSASGRVLVTGLGLGCVVRGLLHNPAVEHVTVIEIDPRVWMMVAPQFVGNPRVEIIKGDALSIEIAPTARWDFAWHDIWTDGDTNLQVLHARLIKRFADHVNPTRQGAWGFPKIAKRVLAHSGLTILGSSRPRRVSPFSRPPSEPRRPPQHPTS